MKHMGSKSLQLKLTVTVVVFTFCLMGLFTALMFHYFEAEEQKNTIRSTELDLVLMTGMLNKNITGLSTLSTWSITDPTVTSYLRQNQPSGIKSISVFNRISNEWHNAPCKGYVQRFIVTGTTSQFLQMGNDVSYNNIPAVASAAPALLAQMADETFFGVQISQDKFSRAQPQTVLFYQPIVINANQVGFSYLAVSPSAFSDPLEQFGLLKYGNAYLTLNNANYEITAGALAPTLLFQKSATINNLETFHPQTTAQTVYDQNGAKQIVLSYPVSALAAEGGTLSLIVPHSVFPWQGGYFLLFGVMCVFILAFSLLFLRYLQHIINRPINQLRYRLDAISGGDFSFDNEIEWADELGDIGKGINILSRNVSDLLEERIADEKLKRDLEYKALQSQMNPHFIYNTLNSIKWMATIQNATGIAEMTTAFSRLLKSVSKGSGKLIPLREELALLNDYCVIQQYRYAGSITLEIEYISDEGLCECMIPRFILQPLAENAIFHGIEPNGGLGNIWLRILQTPEGDICIEMKDNGIGMPPELLEKVLTPPAELPGQKYHRVGLHNVHQRLQYAFGKKYGLSIESVVGEYTKMSILFPRLYGDGSLHVEDKNRH